MMLLAKNDSDVCRFVRLCRKYFWSLFFPRHTVETMFIVHAQSLILLHFVNNKTLKTRLSMEESASRHALSQVSCLRTTPLPKTITNVFYVKIMVQINQATFSESHYFHGKGKDLF